MKPLKYPYTYAEWLAHPSTKPALEWIKQLCTEIRNEKKYGKQLTIPIP